MLTKDQLELRKNGITGSEIAAVAGLSPYAGPLDIWARKLGLVEEQAASPVMDRGTYLERGIRDWYEATTGATVVAVGTKIHPAHPLVIATPDGHSFRQGGDERALEIKAPTYRTMHQWGEEGTDQIPQHYIPQCIWEAAVLGLSRTDVAADLGDHLGLWVVEFDADLFGLLVERAEKFWRDHILTRIAPPAEGKSGEIDTLKALFPRSVTADYVEADADSESIITLYRDTCDHIAALESARDEAKARLMQTIGDKAGIRGPFGRIDYKSNQASIKTDWEAVARELSAPDPLIAKYTQEKTGARPFRAYWNKKGK